MANIKISQLPAATTPLTGAEQVPLVQGGVTKRATVIDINPIQTLQTITTNGATTTVNSQFNGANIGTFSGVPAVTSTGTTVGFANSTNAAILIADAWRGTSNNNVNLGASGYNWNNVYGTTYNVGSGTANITASGNNLVLNAVVAAVPGTGFAPVTTNLYYLGGSLLKWKGLYLSDGDINWNSYAIPAPVGGTTTFLRNDGTWAIPAGAFSTSANNTFTGTQTFNGSSSIFGTVLLSSAETVSVVAAAPSATTNFYVQSGSVQYYTSNAANNWTLNIAFSSGTSMNTALAIGQSVTFVLVTTQGSTAYYNSAVTIDGTSVTPKWIGGAPIAGNVSGLDVYRMTVVKTASATYTVLASVLQYK